MTGVAQVRVRVLWPVLGLAPGQELTLAHTELIAALLEHGFLALAGNNDGGDHPASALGEAPAAELAAARSGEPAAAAAAGGADRRGRRSR